MGTSKKVKTLIILQLALTLNATEQTDLEVVLMPVLLEKGIMGAVVLYTTDCRATYEELKSKGVDLTEPKEPFYGTECVIKDGCGNRFSMTQPKEM